MSEDEIIQQPCPFCGKEGEEDDTLLDEKNILVYKCKRCGKLDGYSIALGPPDGIGPAPRQHSTNPQKKQKPVSLYKLEGYKPVYSAEDAERLAKLLKKAENDPKEKCKRLLRQWVKQKVGVIEKMGVPSQTIEIARRKVEFFIDKNGRQTNKRLVSIFLTSIYIVHNKESSQKITERTIQKSFGIDRKTLRKWKRTLL
jgi:hypothetical protein